MVFSCHFFGFFDTPEFISSVSYIPLFSFFITFFHNGQIGVDLFFVLSGFFIARNLKTKNQSFFVFIYHRLFRLIPVHIVVLMYYIIKYNTYSWTNIFCNIFFINGFIKEMEIINIVTWSLSYEFLFYISFAIFIVLSRKFLFLQRNTVFFAIILTIWTSQFWGESLIAALYNFNIVLPDVNRFFGFFWGIMLSKLLDDERLKNIVKRKVSYLLLPSLLFLILLQWNFEWGRLHKPIYFLSVDMMFFVVILNLLINSSVLSKILTNKLIRIIGVISYSLYLCHCIFIEIIRKYSFGLFGIKYIIISFVLSFITTVIFSITLYILFERRYFAKWNNKMIRMRLSNLCGKFCNSRIKKNVEVVNKQTINYNN